MIIFQIIVGLMIIFMGSFLEHFERQSSKSFWGLTSLFSVLTLLWTPLDNIETRSYYTEQIISEIEVSSDPTNNRPGFVNPNRGNPNPANQKKTNNDNGKGKKFPNPHYPWGTDPKYSGPSGSYDNLDSHKLSSERNNWVFDPSAWDDDARDHRLGVAVDFPYRLNENNEPTLLVPNPGSNKYLGKNRFEKLLKPIRVGFEQTATHLHHAPELGIKLPKKFDMAYYKNLRPQARMDYARAMVPRETIIAYQNEIAKRLCPMFNPTIFAQPGVSGKNKVRSLLVIEKPRDLFPLANEAIRAPEPTGKKDITLSIVSDNYQHISSYLITQERLNRLEAEGWWVLKDRDIY